MRPAILNPLFAPVTGLDGVGPKVAGLLARLLDSREDVTPRVIDLLFHLPTGVIDRTRRPGIARAPEGAVVTVTGRVDRHLPPPRYQPRVPYRVMVHDDSGELALVYFHANRPFLEKRLAVGAKVHVSGTVEWFNGRPQMVHPDYVVSDRELSELPAIEPVYPMTAGLSKKTFLKAISGALEAIPELPEWIEPKRLAAGGWPSFGDALVATHHPAGPTGVDAASSNRVRLAYDELFADQLTLALTRAHMRRSAGRSRRGDESITGRIRTAFRHALTASQERAIAEITADLAKPERMLRLLQGDVGSGKTIVALLAMATAVESGSQAALMAPTEILARQHAETIGPLAEAAGLRTAILTGRETRASRDRVLAELSADGLGDLAEDRGGIDILIGTHALLQEGVRFRDLGLAVVDEQHRFGVQQRLALAAKGEATDILVMTATPIPRSLVLTTFGDMDVSQLREKPAGRKKVDTRIVSTERLDEVAGRIAAALDAGGKVFWVTPLVEESEETPLMSAEVRAETLSEVLRREVGIVHGRMSPSEKDEEMERFRTGRTKVLVATTVIEVGVDVPDASIMVIEHAERFGLAQLHQLRGRVGRGDEAATCLLLYKPPLGPTARARLEILRETDDGFRIAEEDLRLRGEGEILGTKQAGAPGFRLASLDLHADVMEMARDDARRAIDEDPDLRGPRAGAIRNLLYLFGRDAAVRLLRAG